MKSLLGFIYIYISVCVSRSVVPDSLWPHGLQPTKLLCPWDFPGKDTGVGCHFLLQGIFPTRGSNPGLLQYIYIYTISYHLWIVTVLCWIGVVRVDILVLFQILVEELSTFHFWSEVKVPQLCLTLCDPMGYTVHGILQARILEWVAFPFYRGSSQPRNWTGVSCLAGRFFINWAMSHLILFCYCLFLLLSLLIFALYI